MTCPKCGSSMTTPMPGHRTQRIISTCRNPQCGYHHVSGPLVAAPQRLQARPLYQPRLVAPVEMKPIETVTISGRRRTRDWNGQGDGKLRALGGDE